MKYILTLLLTTALFVPACANMPTDKSIDDKANLQMTVQTFHRDMRWKRWEQAAMLVAPDERQQFLGRYEELGDDFHIVELELKSVSRVDKERAIVDIEQKSYTEPVMTVKKERFIEIWKKRDSDWFMTKRMKKDDYREMKKEEAATKDKEAPQKAEASQ